MPKELSEKINSSILCGLSDNLKGSKVIFITTKFFFLGKRKLTSLTLGFNTHKRVIYTFTEGWRQLGWYTQKKHSWHERGIEVMPKVMLLKFKNMVLESETFWFRSQLCAYYLCQFMKLIIWCLSASVFSVVKLR